LTISLVSSKYLHSYILYGRVGLECVLGCQVFPF